MQHCFLVFVCLCLYKYVFLLKVALFVIFINFMQPVVSLAVYNLLLLPFFLAKMAFKSFLLILHKTSICVCVKESYSLSVFYPLSPGLLQSSLF